MIKKIGPITFVSIFLSFLLVNHILAGTDKKDEITIAIPTEVMAKIINDSLPIEITKEKNFSGVIWIDSVEGLKLGDDKIFFSIGMRGEKLGYKGNIGKTPLDLDFGDVNLTFDFDASIRYDHGANILYVKPEINGEKGKEKIFVPLLAALIRGKEFPVEIQKLKPIITKFSNNLLTLQMDISDIRILDNMLYIGLRPTVDKSPPVSP